VLLEKLARRVNTTTEGKKSLFRGSTGMGKDLSGGKNHDIRIVHPGEAVGGAGQSKKMLGRAKRRPDPTQKKFSGEIDFEWRVSDIGAIGEGFCLSSFKRPNGRQRKR